MLAASPLKLYEMVKKMNSTKTKEYETGLSEIQKLQPKGREKCSGIHDKIVSLMEENDAVKSVILLGDHFLDENKDRPDETFSSIEALILSSGDEKENKQYRDSHHKKYVLSFWDEGIYGNIEPVSEEEAERRGGIAAMLTRGNLMAARSITKAV